MLAMTITTLFWIGLIVGLCLALAGVIFRVTLKLAGFLIMLIIGLILAIPCGLGLLGLGLFLL